MSEHIYTREEIVELCQTHYHFAWTPVARQLLIQLAAKTAQVESLEAKSLLMFKVMCVGERLLRPFVSHAGPRRDEQKEYNAAMAKFHKHSDGAKSLVIALDAEATASETNNPETQTKEKNMSNTENRPMRTITIPLVEAEKYATSVDPQPIGKGLRSECLFALSDSYKEPMGDTAAYEKGFADAELKQESRRLHKEYNALVAAQLAGAKNGAEVRRLTDECAAKGIILVPGGETA